LRELADHAVDEPERVVQFRLICGRTELLDAPLRIADQPCGRTQLAGRFAVVLLEPLDSLAS
jgi:hypothetical protein